MPFFNHYEVMFDLEQGIVSLRLNSVSEGTQIGLMAVSVVDYELRRIPQSEASKKTRVN